MSFDWWRRGTKRVTVQELQAQIRREHEAPSTPFTVDEAHRQMQRHRGCAIADCPRKEAAWQVLVAAGKVQPRFSSSR